MKPTPINQSAMTDGAGADMGSTQGARERLEADLSRTFMNAVHERYIYLFIKVQ
jgi:hypothetical protein